MSLPVCSKCGQEKARSQMYRLGEPTADHPRPVCNACRYRVNVTQAMKATDALASFCDVLDACSEELQGRIVVKTMLRYERAFRRTVDRLADAARAVGEVP